MSALSLSDIGLFKGMMAKMDWLDQRQKVLAENVANSDTPNYRPSDLKKADFAALMGMEGGDGATIRQAATSGGHLGGAGNEYRGAKDTYQRNIYESSFDNNGVVLEEQMMKASRNAGEYNMITNLYRRQIGMIKTAIGTQR